jgi:hypothetical protein
MVVFWGFTPCSELCVFLHFGGMYCLHKKASPKSDGGSLSLIRERKKERKKEKKERKKRKKERKKLTNKVASIL